jgi:hypothetical protein
MYVSVQDKVGLVISQAVKPTHERHCEDWGLDPWLPPSLYSPEKGHNRILRFNLLSTPPKTSLEFKNSLSAIRNACQVVQYRRILHDKVGGVTSCQLK